LQQLDLDYVSEDWQPPAQLIDKRELCGVPRHGIGRSCKVGKEQIVGLLTALTRFTLEDDVTRNQRFKLIADTLVDALRKVAGLRVQAFADAGHGGLPLVEIIIGPGTNTPDAARVAARLRAATPAVHVDSTHADSGILILVPTCLTIEDAPAIGTAFTAAMANGG
jgi:L-seryl-tRNA(Ser) seleniumtransferase